jgi:peroxiredoxin
VICNAEAASVEAAREQWAGKVDFVGVAWTGDDAAFQGFVDKYSLTFPTISDDPGTVFQHFSVPAQPALVVISRSGKVKTMLGAVEEATLTAVLTDALV